MATLLAVLLAYASVFGLGTSAAFAATPGISTTVTIGGETYGGSKVVIQGQEITMKVQYSDAVAPGSTVSIKLGANVTLGDIPAGNTAVKSIVQDPTDENAVVLTFADPWPSGISQGVIDLTFTVNDVEHSSHEQITWTIDCEESSIDVVVKKSRDEFSNVYDDSSKNITNNGGLGKFITYDSTTGKVTLADGAIGAPISYTLNVDTKVAKTAYSIADQLPAGLSYDAASFIATQITRDVAKDSNADLETGLSIKFTLDGENVALAKGYADGEFKATEGIDPTWDAGVVLKPEPTTSVEPTEPPVEPSEPTESSDPVVPSESSDNGEGKNDGLASTGFTALSSAIGGLLLVLVGFLLVRARTVRKHG